MAHVIVRPVRARTAIAPFGSRRSGGAASVLIGFWRRRTLAAIASIYVVLIIFMAFGAELIEPFDPLQQGIASRLSPPQAGLWMGSDSLGRDVLSRVIEGSRVSLYVGFASTLAGVALGAGIGIVSGYYGGSLDLLLQRIVDSMMAFPGLVLALLLVTFLGAGVNQSVFAIALVLLPASERVARATTLSVKNYPFIEAAKACGASDARILLRHVLANVTAPIVVVASVGIGGAIILEATLSFLGLGEPPPTPTWGNMLSSAALQHLEHAPWLALFPGLAISSVVLALNTLGDAARDLLDPWQR